MAMKVVALVLGALLGAAAIPYMPDPTESRSAAWLDAHFKFMNGPVDDPYRRFAPHSPSKEGRFE